MLSKVARRSTALGSGDGLTRAELRAVVAEAGLDPAEIDGALAELETRHKTDARLLGLEQYVVAQRSVAGKLDTAVLERAKKLANRSVGIIGEADLDEHGLTWFGRQVSVWISQEGDRVAVVIEERFHNTTRGQLGVGAMFSLMGGAATLVSLAEAGLEPLGFLLGAAIPAVSYAVVRRLHALRIAATRRRLEGLADQLAALLGETSRRALTEGE